MNKNNETSHAMKHDHTFGQHRKKPGETRTLVVVLLTTATMVVEIVAGVAYGSMALLADGLHMASHASALAISLFAYIYARRNAHNDRFCFGTGKVNSLAGYTGAVLLAVIAVAMTWESVHRMFEPVSIAFDQALVVAVLGLLVNGLSVLILGVDHTHTDHHSHEHGDHHAHEHPEHHHAGGHDHNLRSAYLHVLADALTSVFAIAALLAGKYFGLGWLDPVMGVVGGILVARWSFGLAASTSTVLLDHQAPTELRNTVLRSIESRNGDRVVDLHVWSVAPGTYCAIVSVASENPRSPEHYKSLLPDGLGIEHVTVEVHDPSRPGSAESDGTAETAP